MNFSLTNFSMMNFPFVNFLLTNSSMLNLPSWSCCRAIVLLRRFAINFPSMNFSLTNFQMINFSMLNLPSWFCCRAWLSCWGGLWSPPVVGSPRLTWSQSHPRVDECVHFARWALRRHRVPVDAPSPRDLPSQAEALRSGEATRDWNSTHEILHSAYNNGLY